jgi:adenylate kinase family enzyme
MKSVFIGGIPAVGKTFLANKVSKKFDILHVDTDVWREEMRESPELKKWVDFFWNLDEENYWKETTCEEQWKNLIEQSEAFWSVFKEKIINIKEPAIFEGVNLIPHLMKEIDVHGVYLVSDSVDEIFERNKKDPRWGETEELQKIEAEAFVNCESKKYKEEAEKYNYKVVTDVGDAEREVIRLIKS